MVWGIHRGVYLQAKIILQDTVNRFVARAEEEVQMELAGTLESMDSVVSQLEAAVS